MKKKENEYIVFRQGYDVDVDSLEERRLFVRQRQAVDRGQASTQDCLTLKIYDC